MLCNYATRCWSCVILQWPGPLSLSILRRNLILCFVLFSLMLIDNIIRYWFHFILDVDECQDPKVCSFFNQTCQNRPGGFACLCDPGFRLSREFKACRGNVSYASTLYFNISVLFMIICLIINYKDLYCKVMISNLYY